LITAKVVKTYFTQEEPSGSKLFMELFSRKGAL